MPLAPLPPWLQINPAQFMEAARSGSTLGLQIAQTQNRADEAAAERAMQAAAMAAREEQARREEEFRRWEVGQRIQQQAAELAAQQEQAAAQLAEASKYNLARIGEQQAGNLARANYYAGLTERAGAPKIHFGPNGEVLSWSPEGGVEELRPGTPRASTANATTLTWPAVPGEPGVAAVPPSTKKFLGLIPYGTEPGKAAVPEVPARPQITTRIPAGQPLPDFSAGPVMPQGGTPAATLTREKAREFWNQAKGNRAEAERLAKEAGYTF